MSKAYKAAKEKYDAVINDAGRGDYACTLSWTFCIIYPIDYLFFH